MHAGHVADWKFCDLCEIRAPLDCPTCLAVHVRIHHAKRRIRRAEKVRGKR